MKRLLVILSVCVASQWAEAAEPSLFTPVTTQLCSHWRYDFETRLYGCLSPSLSTRLYSASEVDALVQNLDKKIVDLEARVKQLEGGE